MMVTSSELINYSTRVVVFYYYFSLLFSSFYYYILTSFTLFFDNECLCCRFISSSSSTNVSYQLSHSISNLHSTAPILSLLFIITSMSSYINHHIIHLSSSDVRVLLWPLTLLSSSSWLWWWWC
jgi:hypothetical protein